MAVQSTKDVLIIVISTVIWLLVNVLVHSAAADVLERQPFVANDGGNLVLADRARSISLEELLSRLEQAELRITALSTQNTVLISRLEQAEARTILPGTILPFGSGAAPAGYLFCDGAIVSTQQYPALFQAVGFAFSGGSAPVAGNSSLFKLPDLRGRAAIGAGINMPPSALLSNRTLGDSGGEEKHGLNNRELPPHQHGIRTGDTAATAHITRIDSSVPYLASMGINTNSEDPFGFLFSYVTASYREPPTGYGFTTSTSGYGAAHNNMQPFTVVNFIIKI